MALPRRTPTSNTTLALVDGNEDNDLWLERKHDHNQQDYMHSVWQLNDEERAAIAAGANIYLNVWGTGHPPVAIGVTDEPIGKAGDDARST